MTWNEWCFYSAGLHKAKTKEWEHTRAISWMLYRANADPKKAATKMEQWWKLPTDKGYQKPGVKSRPKGKRLTIKQEQDFFNSMR